MTRDIKIFHILSTLRKLTLHYTDSWLDLTIWIAGCYVKLDFCSSVLWPGRRCIVNGTSNLKKKKKEWEREKGKAYVDDNNMYKQMLQNSIKAERKNVALGNAYCRTGRHFLCNSPSKHAGIGITIVRSGWECSLAIVWKSIVLFIWRMGKGMWSIVFKGKNYTTGCFKGIITLIELFASRAVWSWLMSTPIGNHHLLRPGPIMQKIL